MPLSDLQAPPTRSAQRDEVIAALQRQWGGRAPTGPEPWTADTSIERAFGWPQRRVAVAVAELLPELRRTFGVELPADDLLAAVTPPALRRVGDLAALLAPRCRVPDLARLSGEEILQLLRRRLAAAGVRTLRVHALTQLEPYLMHHRRAFEEAVIALAPWRIGPPRMTVPPAVRRATRSLLVSCLAAALLAAVGPLAAGLLGASERLTLQAFALGMTVGLLSVCALVVLLLATRPLVHATLGPGLHTFGDLVTALQQA